MEPYLVVEADVDEVPVLQPGALQDGGEVAAEVVPAHDVVVSGVAPTAATGAHWGLERAARRRRHGRKTEAGSDQSPLSLQGAENGLE